MSRINDTIKWFVSLLCVKKCIACGELLEYDCDEYLCPKCKEEWDEAKRTVCPRCFKTEVKCCCGFGNRYVSSVRHLALYDHTDRDLVTNKLVYALKKSNNDGVFDFVAREMAEQLIDKRTLNNAVVVNVPRSPASIRRYGYDHAKKLAKKIAEDLGVEYADVLGHLGGKREQKKLGMLQRKMNARKNCFFKKNMVEKIKGKTVYLVDDIGTTGAMTDVCSTLLRKNGAKEVHCVLAARNKLHTNT